MHGCSHYTGIGCWSREVFTLPLSVHRKNIWTDVFENVCATSVPDKHYKGGGVHTENDDDDDDPYPASRRPRSFRLQKYSTDAYLKTIVFSKMQLTEKYVKTKQTGDDRKNGKAEKHSFPISWNT